MAPPCLGLAPAPASLSTMTSIEAEAERINHNTKAFGWFVLHRFFNFPNRRKNYTPNNAFLMENGIPNRQPRKQQFYSRRHL
uniref:Uncharacterized protein n=1 Tax=Pristionchus pacificus TaxID=54126 RepID=A0A2A6CHK9_PRIPA|eukprot:PDM77619.1 hypothetical protein PRIPAC_34486 [Pristionchus pacificus]